jgi:hypothetical protein
LIIVNSHFKLLKNYKLLKFIMSTKNEVHKLLKHIYNLSQGSKERFSALAKEIRVKSYLSEDIERESKFLVRQNSKTQLSAIARDYLNAVGGNSINTFSS